MIEFTPTEEQQALIELVRRIVRDEILPLEAELDPDAAELRPQDYQRLKRMVQDLGLYGMDIPEEFGGPGLDVTTRALLAMEMTQHRGGLYTACYGIFGGAGLAQLYEATDDQKQRYLPRLAAGEIGAYSLSEAGAGTDAAALSCRAKLSDDGLHYILNGEKMWVTNGQSAGIFVLFAKDVDHPDYGVKKHGGTTAFIVESSMEGFNVGKKEDKLGIRSSDTCVLLLDNCKVPVENVLKEVGKGFPIAMNALDNSRIGIAAQGLGIAQGAYESALNYAHERQAFGKPIALHQSIGNYLADMATQTEAARHMVYKAAWAKQRHYEQGAPRHSMEASMAKLFAGDTAMWVAERAVQILGGYGYTTDFPVERFFRDAKITQIYEGTQEVQRIVISRSISP